MNRRTVSRAALCAAVLASLVQPAPRARAETAAAGQTLNAELSRVAEINQRRRALTMQLARQRLELTRGGQRAEALEKQLDAPERSIDAAPVARARLLDEASDALGQVAYLSGQLQAGYAELHELEGELADLLASADAELAQASADVSAPGARMRMLKAKQRALSLRARAQLGPPKASADKLATLTADLERWKLQQRAAEERIEKAAAEPRFASLTATPPRNLRMAQNARTSKVETLRACSVRDVDWPNITIDVAGRSVQLIDGQGPLTPQGTDESVSVRIKQSSFGDTNGNGREEVFLLVEREEVTTSWRGEHATERDGLYVLESAPDCSMRQLAELVLAARGIAGKPVAGGYDYEGHDAFREFRWIDGVFKETTVRSRLARVIR